MTKHLYNDDMLDELRKHCYRVLAHKCSELMKQEARETLQQIDEQVRARTQNKETLKVQFRLGD